jgi:chitinase
VREWWDKQRNVDIKYDGVRHRIKVGVMNFNHLLATIDDPQETFIVDLIDQKIECFDWTDELYFKAWTELDVDVKAAGGVTVIVSPLST